MKEDRYLCLGLNEEQKRYIARNIDKPYCGSTISIEYMYRIIQENQELFKGCIVTKDKTVIVQKIVGQKND